MRYLIAVLLFVSAVWAGRCWARGSGSQGDLAPRPEAAFPAGLGLSPIAVPESQRLHLLATPLGKTAASDFAIDATGKVTGSVPLPLSQIDSAALCEGVLVVAGRRDESAAPEVLAVSLDGTVRWRRGLPASEPIRFLRVLCLGGHAEVLWLDTRDRGTLWRARAEAGAPATLPATPALRGYEIVEMDAVASGASATLLVSGRDRAEIIRLVGDRPTRRTPLKGQARGPSLAAIGDRFAALWMDESGGRLVVQWFDWMLTPLGNPATLLEAAEGSSFLGGRLVAGDPARLALVAGQRKKGPGLVSRPRGPRHIAPRTSDQTLVAAYDPSALTLGPTHTLEGAAARDACGWLGDVLLVVDGAESPRIAPFVAVVKK